MATRLAPVTLDGRYVGFVAMDVTVQNALQAVSEAPEPSDETLFLFNLRPAGPQRILLSPD